MGKYDLDMPADPALPPYLRIAADLESQIRSGHLAPGARVLPIMTLAHDYDVNKNTVVKAIDVLKTRKLIVSRQGYGIFVAGEIPDK